MSDNGENPTNTSMDQRVNTQGLPKQPLQEKYENKGLGGLPLADKPSPVATTPTALTSATMSEIERTLANDTLRPPRQKLDALAKGMNQRSDFRLRMFTDRYARTLKEDYKKETLAGASATKVRDFDISAQATRSVGANAALSSYQFQKNLQLPYMRKNLALSYQKVTLLKEVVLGIRTLEKSLLAKLDAVKVNTASAAPRKVSFLKAVMLDARQKNIGRIGTNISNLTMNAWDKRYRKIVTPATQKLHDLVSRSGVSGGINGLRRKSTDKLNSLRRSLRGMDTEVDESTSRMGRLKAASIKYATKTLDHTVGFGQRVRLGEKANNISSTVLKNVTEPLATFNPFAGPGDNAPRGPTLLDEFKNWREEYAEHQKRALLVLEEIRENLGGTGKASKIRRRRPIITTDPTPEEPAPIPREYSGGERSLGEAIRRRRAEDQARAEQTKARLDSIALFGKTKGISAYQTARNLPGAITQGFRDRKAAKQEQQEALRLQRDSRYKSPLDEFYESPKQHLMGFLKNPFTKSPSETIVEGTARPIEAAHEATNTARNQQLSELTAFNERMRKSLEDKRQGSDAERERIMKMMGRISEQLGQVNQTIDEGNEDRSKFEKTQTNWHADEQKLLHPRKGSYEDTLMQREKKGGIRGALETLGRGAKNAAKTAGGALLSGDLVGAAGSLVGDAASWAGDQISDFVGDKLKDGAKGAWRKAKLMSSKRGRSLLRARNAGRGGFLKRIAAGAVKGGGKLLGGAAALTSVGGIKSVSGKVLGAGGKLLGMGAGAAGTAAAASGGASLLGKAGSLALKGGSLLKGGLISAGVGLGADAADGWLDKNATGGWKRLGKTATKAASWGSTGATIGMLGGPLAEFTVPLGAAIGGAAGAIAANTDLLADGLKKAGGLAVAGAVGYMNLQKKTGQFLWESVAGKDAVIDKKGQVVTKEKPSLFQNIKSTVFGADAKYTKDGQVVAEGATGLMGYVKKGFAKFLFGDEIKNGQYKPGSSIVEQIGKNASSFFGDLKKTLGSLLSGAGSLVSDAAQGAGNFATNAYNTVSTTLSGALDGVTSMLGFGEKSDNGQIRNYLKQGGQLTDIDPASTAWCAAFVNATLAKAGIKGSGSLAASSFKNWGSPVDPKQVQRGDVLVENRGAAVGASGDHVGLATGETRVGKGGGIEIEMISGNNGKAGTVKKVFYPASKLVVRRANDQTGVGGGGATPPGLSSTNNPWASPSSTGFLGNSGAVVQNGMMMGYNPFAASMGGQTVGGGQGFNTYNYGINGTNYGSSGSLTGGSGAFKDAVNYLTSKKRWPMTAAIGIAGNLYGESGLRPDSFNSAGGGQGAKGIAQWRGGRITEIEKRAGKPIQSMSLQEQLDAVDWELRENKHITNANIPNGQAPIASAISQASNMESVIEQMVHRYERPGNAAAEVAKRIQTTHTLMGKMAVSPAQDAKANPKQAAASTPAKSQPATKAAAPKQAAAKPAATKAPAVAAKAPAKSNEHSAMSDLTSSINSLVGKLGGVFDGGLKGGAGNTTNVAVGKTTKANPVAAVTMSMDKRSVRTGA